MAVDQECAAEPIEEQCNLLLNCAMIGAVGLVEPFGKLHGRNRPPPKIAVLLGPGGHDAEPTASPRSYSSTAGAIDDCGIDVVFCSVAIDRCAGGLRNDRPATTL